MTDLESQLKLTGDASGALKALDQTNKAADQLTDSVKEIGPVGNKSTKQLEDGLKAIQKSAESASDPVDRLIAGIKEAQSTAESGIIFSPGELPSPSKAGGKTLGADKIKDIAGAFGDLDSALSATQGGALSAISGVEQLANAAIALGPVGIVAGGAIGALVVGFAALNQIQADSTKELRDLIDRSDEYYKLLITGGKQDVEAAIAAKKQEIAIAEARSKDLEEIREAQSTALGSIQREFARATGGTFGGINKNIIDAADSVFEVDQQLQTANKELKDLESILASNATAANDAAQRLEEIATEEESVNKERQQHIATLQSLRQQETELIAASKERQRIQQEDIDLRKKRQQEDDTLKSEFDARKAELDALFESEDAAEAALQRQSALQERLVAIEQQGAQQIASLRQQLVDRIAEANSAVNDLTTDFNNERRKAEEAYQREAVKRQRDYEQRRLDIEQSFNVTRLQAFARQDALSLFFASLAKDEELNKLNREETQANDEASENFVLEQKERQAAFDQRITEIQNELAEFQASQQKKIETEQQAIQQRIEAEQASFAEQERLLADADAKRQAREQAYSDLQDELDKRRRELIQQRESEDARIKEARERDALNAQLDKIDEAKDAQIDALDALILKAVQLKQEAQQIQFPQTTSQLTLTQGLTQNLIDGFGGTAKPLPPPQLFASGARFTQPTTLQNARFGEQGEELLIPKSRMNEFGNTSISTPISVTVNGGVPEDEERLARAIARIVEPELKTVITSMARVLRAKDRPKNG